MNPPIALRRVSSAPGIRLLIVSALALGAAFAPSARSAEVEILSSVPDNNSPTVSYVPGYGIGFPFVSGEQATTVTSVVVGYQDSLSGGSLVGPEGVVMRIYAADGADARPGTLLREFVFSSKEGSFATFVPASATPPGAVLAANSSFWIAIFNTAPQLALFPYVSVMEGANLTYTGMTGYAFTGGELNSDTNGVWTTAPSGSGNNRRIRVALRGTINSATPPVVKPTVHISGPARVTTTKALVTLRGTSTNATRVEFKAGNAPYKATSGTPGAWTVKVRPGLGTTVVQVRSTGPGGTSTVDKVTIIRK
jgi:hypothetical protein